MGMRDYKFTLTAGQERDLNVAGNYFQVMAASGDIGIRFDEGARITRQQGTGGSADYQRVSVYSPIAQTVTLALGNGVATDNRATLNATINTTIEPADTITPLAEVAIAAGATVQLAPANASRKELRIGVKSDEANGVYIGNASASAATPGGYIEVGSIEYIATEAAVYGYNSGGSSISVNVMELSK